jgi:hypothetical protein
MERVCRGARKCFSANDFLCAGYSGVRLNGTNFPASNLEVGHFMSEAEATATRGESWHPFVSHKRAGPTILSIRTL